ncbi:hypothetical protein GGR57DRAFT_277147 [Xylariaceae sp. FL1272]|nr:hypothetical protein GGR57DRAFT_277147 [Xylariaceae sp. FL1272]
MRLSLCDLALYMVAAFLALSDRSAAEDDVIDYTTGAGWDDLTKCVRCIFIFNVGYCDYDGHNMLVGAVDCETNKCLCQAVHLRNGVDFLEKEVSSDCGTTAGDQSSATSFLKGYCSDHGYISIAPAEVTVTTTEGTSSSKPVQTTPAETKPTPSSTSFTSTPSNSSLRPTDMSTSVSITHGSSSTTPSSHLSSTTAVSTSISNQSSKNGDDEDRIEPADLVGIIVGVLGLLVSIFGIWLSYKTGRPKVLWHRRRSQDSLQEPANVNLIDLDIPAQRV